jgi:glycosyltransferase involved in cell wall biosynthesis
LRMQPFLFISIGSLISLKRHQDLVAAFHQQFATDEKVQLVIAGDGELKQELQSQINRLGLHHRIQLTDRINRPQVLQLIDQSNAMVLCSDIETFGVVLIEALSRGKPVIATKCGGPESIVEESNGLLCPIGDINALAKAMLQLKENYQQYLPAQIRAAALQRYGRAALAQQLIKEYEVLIS